MITSIELTQCWPITGNDTADLPNGAIRAISCNGAGNIVYVTTGGSEGTLAAQPGVIYYLNIRRVKVSTATGIYGYR